MSMNKIFMFSLLLFFSYLLNAPALSETAYKCPEKIAFIHHNLISEDATIILKDVYKKLNCKTTFVGLPAKRALIEFNRSKYSGETLRIEAVEKKYTASFVRSDVPLFLLTKSLWKHPTLKTHATGYLLGVIWHEQYMKDKIGVAFHNGAEMYEAYNKGKIGSFLANDYTVHTMVKERTLEPTPFQEQVLESVATYHYLHEEFSPFMQAFTDYIKKHTPFTNFAVSSN